jgi:hypothetical protein
VVERHGDKLMSFRPRATLREGQCADCGEPVSRVGGGRRAEPEAAEMSDDPPRDDGQGNLFSDTGRDHDLLLPRM